MKKPDLTFAWVLLAGTTALALFAAPARADDTLFIEAGALDHGGESLFLILPNGRPVASQKIAGLCVNALAAKIEILEINLDQGTCKASSASAGRLPVLSMDELPPFDSVAACVSARYAVLEDGSGSASTCFRWFRCDDLAFTILGAEQICEGESIDLDAGTGFESYLWTPGGESTRTITVNPFVDTLYGVEVEDEWGCQGTDHHMVAVNPAPEPTIIGPAGVCPGDAATLDAGAGFASYSWGPGGQTTPSIEVFPVSTTDYWVEVVNGEGCSGFSSDHQVEVWSSPTPVISGPSTVVLGQTITLEAAPGFSTYLWSTGETTQTIQVSPTEQTGYTVSVTDGNGCPGISPEHQVDVTPSTLFSDDFETGDTSMWSEHVN